MPRTTFFLQKHEGTLGVKMCDDDVKETTVIIKKGLYEWLVMPFWLEECHSHISKSD